MVEPTTSSIGSLATSWANFPASPAPLAWRSDFITRSLALDKLGATLCFVTSDTSSTSNYMMQVSGRRIIGYVLERPQNSYFLDCAAKTTENLLHHGYVIIYILF